MHKLETLNCRVIAMICWKVDIEGHWLICRFYHIYVDVLKSSTRTVSRCRKSEPQGSKEKKATHSASLQNYNIN